MNTPGAPLFRALSPFRNRDFRLLWASGFGSVASVLVVAALANIHHHGRVYMGGAMLAMLALLLFSSSHWYTLSLSVLLVYGLGAGVFTTMQPTVIMLLSREDMRGKALGVVTLAIGMGLVGHLVIGAVADARGISFAIGLNAAVGVLGLTLIGLFMPSLARRRTLEERR